MRGRELGSKPQKGSKCLSLFFFPPLACVCFPVPRRAGGRGGLVPIRFAFHRVDWLACCVSVAAWLSPSRWSGQTITRAHALLSFCAPPPPMSSQALPPPPQKTSPPPPQPRPPGRAGGGGGRGVERCLWPWLCGAQKRESRGRPSSFRHILHALAPHAHHHTQHTPPFPATTTHMPHIRHTVVGSQGAACPTCLSSPVPSPPTHFSLPSPPHTTVRSPPPPYTHQLPCLKHAWSRATS